MIDWTKPLEHVDGTKVSFLTCVPQPDNDGDYTLVREDGLDFTSSQLPRKISKPTLIVDDKGKDWLKGGEILIRNRSTIDGNIQLRNKTMLTPTMTFPFIHPTKEGHQARVMAYDAKTDKYIGIVDGYGLTTWDYEGFGDHPLGYDEETTQLLASIRGIYYHRKIAGIKLIKTIFPGLGLREAKELFEQC